MSEASAVAGLRPWIDRLGLKRRHLPLAATIGLFALLFGGAGYHFDGFFTAQNFLNLLIDNSFLLITAIGMTFVIISGGIDLSVGSVIALTTMVLATLMQRHGWSPSSAIPLVLLMGAGIGFAMGLIIQYFNIQAFIVTLAGMFLTRGLCYLISLESITIDNDFYIEASSYRVPLPFETSITLNVVIGMALLVIAIYLAHFTRFGRTVYAIGGSEQSAVLMGLPVPRTKVLIYTFSGFCSAMAGIAVTFYMGSGYALHAQGLEMDAIAAVVIGGTLLTGGSGTVIGTLFGVLICGTIQTIITYDGTFSSWWTKIVIGFLLLVACVLQRIFERSTRRA